MVNNNEQKIVEKYGKEGWKAIRGGWPDFIFFKSDKGKIVEWIAVEVKTPIDRLSWEQQICRQLLEQAGIKYKLEVIDGNAFPTSNGKS